MVATSFKTKHVFELAETLDVKGKFEDGASAYFEAVGVRVDLRDLVISDIG